MAGSYPEYFVVCISVLHAGRQIRHTVCQDVRFPERVVYDKLFVHVRIPRRKVQFGGLFSAAAVDIHVLCRGIFRQADPYEEIPEMDGKKAYTAAGIRRQTRTFILCCPYACDLRNVYCSTVGSVVF